MLAQWKLQPDTGQRLVYRRGSLSPPAERADVSGFAQSRGCSHGKAAGATYVAFCGAGFGAARIVVWRWAAGEGVTFGAASYVRHGGRSGGDGSGRRLARLVPSARLKVSLPRRHLTFLAPVQQAGSALTVEVSNVAAGRVRRRLTCRCAWPVLLALARGFLGGRGTRSFQGGRCILGWTLLAWAALRSPNGVPVFSCHSLYSCCCRWCSRR